VRLFVDRATAIQPAFALTAENASAVAQICRRLDGLPLTIELAAARVNVLSPEQIAVRLDDRFRLLMRGSRAAVPRHQTLRALIDWSYDLLDPWERRLLRQLAVFQGGWTLEAAEEVWAATGAGAATEALDLLAQLVDKSLVTTDQHGGVVRYDQLETIRQYGRDRLADTGEVATAREQHCRWYAAFAEQANREIQGGDQRAWLGRCDREHDNLRAALAWSLEMWPTSLA
jgi:non-specific serine/threonine protein kinase